MRIQIYSWCLPSGQAGIILYILFCFSSKSHLIPYNLCLISTGSVPVYFCKDPASRVELELSLLFRNGLLFKQKPSLLKPCSSATAATTQGAFGSAVLYLLSCNCYRVKVITMEQKLMVFYKGVVTFKLQLLLVFVKF